MKLCIKQKVFSWGEKFYVTDEFGWDRYYVQGEVFTLGKKLHIYNKEDQEIAFISQKMWSFLPRFLVFCCGEKIAEIVKDFTFLRPKYHIAGINWDINGNFLAHDYEITQNETQIVTVHKEWFSWGDCYTLDIADPINEIMALAVVLAIDCVLSSQSNNSAISIMND